MIKTIVTNIKQASDLWEVETILQVAHTTDTRLCSDFLVTVIYRSRQEEQRSRTPLVIVPGEIQYAACERLRTLILNMDINEFPLQAQQAISYGRIAKTEAEVCFI